MTLVFGAGLIGRAILRALRIRVDFEATDLPFDWTKPAKQRLDVEAIRAHVTGRLAAIDRINFLWSAGKGVFFATTADVAVELQTYRDVLAMAEGFARQTKAPV